MACGPGPEQWDPRQQVWLWEGTQLSKENLVQAETLQADLRNLRKLEELCSGPSSHFPYMETPGQGTCPLNVLFLKLQDVGTIALS